MNILALVEKLKPQITGAVKSTESERLEVYAQIGRAFVEMLFGQLCRTED